MLRKLVLKNYRCFENSEIDIKRISVIVGSNNAGKSTLVEALRIVGYVSSHFKRTNYILIPDGFPTPQFTRGISISNERLKIDLRTIIYQYKENTYAQIIAYFDNNVVINIYITHENIYAVITADKKVITKKSEAAKVSGINVYIMPQLGLIREDEPVLTKETVIKDMSTRLSSRHFRNELYLYRDQQFNAFRELAQSTWPGLRVEDVRFNPDTHTIELIVIDSDFAAEIGMMGSGLQMWLQIIWFISSCPQDATVILDEPDVYMHPDMQKKVLKIVKDRFKQVIVATHSIEIISSVEPNQIATVEKSNRKMHYAGNYRAVQDVISSLGSDHNLSLSKLGTYKKCLFVEGQDIKILSKLQDIVYPNCKLSIEQLTSVSLGGWSRFKEALGAARLFYEETHGEIQTYCLLDRDYHSDDEIASLYKTAEDSHLALHVWKRKEIENYIITPQSVFRLTNLGPESFQRYLDNLNAVLDSLYCDTLDAVMDQLGSQDKSKSPSYFRKEADQIMANHWDTIEKKISYVSGKELCAKINSMMKNTYGISCSKNKLLSALLPEEIPDELKETIDMLLK